MKLTFSLIAIILSTLSLTSAAPAPAPAAGPPYAKTCATTGTVSIPFYVPGNSPVYRTGDGNTIIQKGRSGAFTKEYGKDLFVTVIPPSGVGRIDCKMFGNPDHGVEVRTMDSAPWLEKRGAESAGLIISCKPRA